MYVTENAAYPLWRWQIVPLSVRSWLTQQQVNQQMQNNSNLVEGEVESYTIDPTTGAVTFTPEKTLPELQLEWKSQADKDDASFSADAIRQVELSLQMLHTNS